MEEEDCIFELLCSKSRLDRERGLNHLNGLVVKNESCLVNIKQSLTDLLKTKKTLEWEEKVGCLLTVISLSKTGSLNDVEINEILDQALDWLENEPEVRVKDVISDLLFTLCQVFGDHVFHKCKDKVIELCHSHLERKIDPDQDEKVIAMRPGTEASGKLMDRKEWKNLAAWKHLELTLACLGKMFRGLGSGASDNMDEGILKLLFKCICHENRFVRDSGFKTLSMILSNSQNCEKVTTDIVADKTDFIDDKNCNDEDAGKCDTIIKDRGFEISQHLASGLEDNWAIVRLSSTIATKDFIFSLPKNQREKYLSLLLPRLCLNRYFSAEGVKVQSQKAWKDICGHDGRQLLAKNIEATVKYYQESCKSENYAVREAACHSLREIGVKIEQKIIEPHISSILESLFFCCNDQLWPVRDVAGVASSIIIKHHPTASEHKSKQFLEKYLSNLLEATPSIRKSAAVSIPNILSVFCDQYLKLIIETIKKGLEGLKDQPGDNENKFIKHEETESNLKTVASINKGDLGGVSEAISLDARECEPWMISQGCVWTLAEISKIKSCQAHVSQLLPVLFSSCHHKHYSNHLSYFISVVSSLTTIVSSMEKKYFKSLLELDVIFMCLNSDNNNAKSAAEECLLVLSKVLGPNILRGRVENFNPQYVSSLDAIMPTMMPSSAFRNSPFAPLTTAPQKIGHSTFGSSPMEIPSRNSPLCYPSLGGTPPH